jgi:peptide/nickel transport system permease protein
MSGAAATGTDVASAAARRRRPRPVWIMTLGRAMRTGRMRIGLAMTATVTAIALFGPLVARHSESELVGPPYEGPTAEAPLGTDYLGEDVLSRVLYGGQSVLLLAVSATVIAMLMGVSIGLIAGYSRGLAGDVLMGATDVVLAFPQIVLVILFVSVLGPELWLIALITAVSHAPRIARVTRGVTVELSDREFVQAAEVLGVPRRRLLMREILPNLTTPLTVEFGLRLTWSIGLVAAVSFLGFGLQPPSADWGLMLNENRNGLTIQPWAIVAPALMITILTVGTNLMAEGFARASSGVDRSVNRGRPRRD